MILLLAADVAAAAQACPTDTSAPAYVCQALAAQQVGRHAEGADGFEMAAAATPASDPAQARMFAAAGNLWISAGQPAKAARRRSSHPDVPKPHGTEMGWALSRVANSA